MRHTLLGAQDQKVYTAKDKDEQVKKRDRLKAEYQEQLRLTEKVKTELEYMMRIGKDFAISLGDLNN